MTDPFITDRRELAKVAPPKDARYPRTGRRLERIQHVLERRQPDLTVVLENVHDPHNLAAVLRSCDAVGAMRVHFTMDPDTKPHRAFSRRSSGSAAKWIDVVEHPAIEDCYTLLRDQGFAILATGGGPTSLPMSAVDLTAPVAIVLGNEMRGLSDAAMGGADLIVTIPMVGMIRSLNISVACAVLLYEAFRQRDADGFYDAPRLDRSQIDSLAKTWEKR
jgi:tRNA (guanosine-2'-O-)-methyltransferase